MAPAAASGNDTLRNVISQNASRLTDIVRLAPHVQEGQVVGFRVNPGRDRESFEALGLLPGDVVTDINGVVLDDPSRGLAGLRGARRSDDGERHRAAGRNPDSPRDRHEPAAESPGEPRVISASAPPASGETRPRRRAARTRHAALVVAGFLGTAHVRVRAAAAAGAAAHAQLPRGRHPRRRGSGAAGHRPARSSSTRASAPRSRCCRTRRCRPTAFYRLFLSTLEVHGFVALDSGDAIQIVPDANARFGAGDDYVTQAIVLDNIGAAQLVPILRPLLPQSAHLAAHPPSNALIVADRPNNIARMLSLIRRMDQAGTQEIEVIGLENASADEVVRMLELS